MEYFKAITILGIETFKDLNAQSLKKLKKQIFLEFELEQSEVISRGDYEFDKNDVVKVFEVLDDKIEVFQFINNIHSLQLFLSTNDTSFFREDDYLKIDNEEAKKIKEEIQDLLVPYLNDFIPSLVLESSKKSREDLEDIRAYLQTLPPEKMQQAYKKTYIELTEILKELNELERPFTEEWGDTFLPIVREYITNDFYDTLKALPEFMEKFVNDYCLWCSNTVASQAIIDRNYLLFPVETLQVLKDAFIIVERKYKNRGIQKWIKKMENAIQIRKKRDQELLDHKLDLENRIFIRRLVRIIAAIIAVCGIVNFLYRFYNLRN